MVREGLRVCNDPRNSQGMSGWITDRLPTKADADVDGDAWTDLLDADELCFPLSADDKTTAADQPEPTFEDPYAQAKLEHLRAKTALLQAQAMAFTRSEPGTPRINLASMPYAALLKLQGDIAVELSAREA
jgi:hypothetical protein